MTQPEEVATLELVIILLCVASGLQIAKIFGIHLV